jgi:hypothetical protein
MAFLQTITMSTSLCMYLCIYVETQREHTHRRQDSCQLQHGSSILSCRRSDHQSVHTNITAMIVATTNVASLIATTIIVDMIATTVTARERFRMLERGRPLK